MNPENRTMTDLERLHDKLNHRRCLAEVRTPATIDPDDRDKWRGFAASSAHLGRTVETFVTHAVADGRRSKHAEYTLTRQNIEREIKALCAEFPGAFPSSQAGLAAVRGVL